MRANQNIRTLFVSLLAGALLLAAACSGEDPALAARQRKGESEAAKLELARRGQAQAVDAQLQRLNQLLTQMEQTHQAQMRETQAQTQKLAAQLDELKRSLNMEVAPTVVSVPEVPDEVAANAGATQQRVEDYRSQARPYGFMARLFFLVILVLAVGLIFHVIMSRVQEEEDDEGEDKLYKTEEGTISLSPRAQRESKEYGGSGGPGEPGPEI